MFSKASNSSPSKFSGYCNLFYSIMIFTAHRSNQMYIYYTAITVLSTAPLRKAVNFPANKFPAFMEPECSFLFSQNPASIIRWFQSTSSLSYLISILILSSHPDLGGSGITVLIFNTGARRRWEVIMTPVALPIGTRRRCLFNSKLGGPHSRPGQKNIKILGVNLCRPARIPFAIVNAQSRLYLPI